MKRKVVFVINDMGGGGAEKVLLNILKNLDRTKFFVKLFLIENSGIYLDDIPEDVEVFHSFDKLPTGKINRLLSKISIEKKLQTFADDCDILVSFLEYYPTYLVAKVSKKLKKKSIAWIHTNFNRFLTLKHRVLGNHYYKFINKVFVVSEECKDIAIGEINSLKGKTFTMYNPIDIFDIQQKAEILNENNMQGIKLIGIGRLNSGKAFDDLIRAHGLLKDKEYNTKLILLGEGPCREALQNLIKELSLEDSVYMPGFVSNPYSWLKSSDIFVLSSKYEGLPTVIIEALALNKPVVATNCSGVAELLEKEKYGKIASIGDYKSIAIAIEDIINKNYVPKEGLCRAMDFDKSTIIKKIEYEFLNI